LHNKLIIEISFKYVFDSFVQICNALVSTDYPKEEFARHFLNDLEKLASDRVINVRIALARLVGELCRMGISLCL
jgi:hypothetical protein